VTNQGYPPRQAHQSGIRGRPGRTRAADEQRSSGWQVIDAFDDRLDEDSDLPPWAGPAGIQPLRPARRAPRAGEADRPSAPRPVGPPRDIGPPRDAGPAQPGEPARFDEPGEGGWPAEEPPGRLRRGPRRGRAAAARRRRSKRRLVTWGSVAVAAVVFTGLGIYLSQSQPRKAPYITSLQKGEFNAVPDACKVVSPSVLRAIMKGAPRTIQPQNGKAQSECTFTVDASPVFRVMNVNLQALGASLAPVGNGSATANAKYEFGLKRAQLLKPPKRTAQPPATVSAVPGLGQQAISALQTFRDQSATEIVTVLARYKNVLIRVSVQGQAGNGFGPVSVGELRAGAIKVARTSLSSLQALPTV
jgi:hypothetical protein